MLHHSAEQMKLLNVNSQKFNAKPRILWSYMGIQALNQGKLWQYWKGAFKKHVRTFSLEVITDIYNAEKTPVINKYEAVYHLAMHNNIVLPSTSRSSAPIKTIEPMSSNAFKRNICNARMCLMETLQHALSLIHIFPGQ